MANSLGAERRNPRIRRIGILGAKCSHTHLAFLDYCKDHEDYLTSFFETKAGMVAGSVFDNLGSSVAGSHKIKSDCALIPGHNSSEKCFFEEVSPLLLKNGVYVVDLTRKYIKHSLLVNKQVNQISEIQKIITNRHCHLQTKTWRGKHRLNEWEETASSSEAAKKLHEDEYIKYAVIGTEEAAREYSLKILESSIEEPNNYTSFFVISNRERCLKDNRYILYSFPAKNTEERSKIEERIIEFHFTICASWHTKQEGGHYFFQLYVGEDEKKVISFDSQMEQEYKGFRRIGRLNKNIADYAKSSP